MLNLNTTFDASIKTHRNNFNLIRIILASAVMLYHSFALNTAYKDALDPASIFLVKTTGIDLGRFAVDIFFVISGIFVTQSWLKDPHLGRFAARRFTRLVPALFFCTIILGLSAVIFFSQGGYHSLFSVTPWMFFLRTSLLTDVLAWSISAEYDPRIPGVFAELENSIFNGSLWTLIWEARFYILLSVIGSVLTFKRKTSLIIISIFCFALMLFKPLLIKPVVWEFDLLSCFISGIIITCIADLIKSRFVWPFIILCGILIYSISHLTGIIIMGASAAIWIGGLRRIFFKHLQFNDYSYGIYIYHWPVIQMLRSAIDSLGPVDLFILAGLIVLPSAVLSWHFVEKPSMQFIRLFLRRLKDQPEPLRE
jgi:peptidoglycan/LPS O-acetylase OafA/YrhL